jgi:hypothetical protein
MFWLTFVFPQQSENLMNLGLTRQMPVSPFCRENFRSPNELPSVLCVDHRDLSPSLAYFKILFVGLHRQRKMKNLKEMRFLLSFFDSEFAVVGK